MVSIVKLSEKISFMQQKMGGHFGFGAIHLVDAFQKGNTSDGY